ncbi:MAG TPA: T9SS C-terminal target domain-containing protein, partial [Bacteroidia bacterium]|nr:T9SS C-terminal target domain-containing protein [Bacteroidia bacterium]
MKIVCLLPFAFCFFNSFSQTCCIEWQKCLGGSNDDFGSVVRQTADGGYIACGYTWSSDGDVSGLHQSLGVYCDAWLVKTDSAGNILWQKCRGGSYGDGFFDVRTTTDSGYIAAGFTWSNDFDVSGNHGVAGAQSDFWITKLDSAGELIWQKCFGGSGDDEAKMVQQTPDGGYIVAGTTFSNDGDALGSHGDFDALVFRLDSAGNILWHKCLGGTEEEKIQTVEQEADGGFIFSIFTKSNDGDVSGNHGFGDAWFVKTDSSGNMVWQRCIGGNYDDNAAAFSRTADGGFILTGHSGSDDSIFTSCNGVNNFDF